MKNPAIHIKKKLFSLLNGAVSYGGSTVYVEEGNGKHGLPNQILIGEYSDSNASNKHNFRYNGTQVIEIMTERNHEASKDADAIAGMVMNILQPDTRSETMSGDEFQVFVVGTPSKNLLRETGTGTAVIVRRILRYQLLVIER